MSRGLGKIERKIIEALKEREKEAEKKGWDKWTFLGNLAYDVFDGELIDVCMSNPFSTGDVIIGEEPTRAQYVSVWRAVKSLERKGVVQTKREIAGFMERNTGHEWGGVSCLVKVMLSVDSSAKQSCNQHLNGKEEVNP
jgi:hypothetical protein